MQVLSFWRWHSWLIGLEFCYESGEGLIIFLHLLCLEVKIDLSDYVYGTYSVEVKSPLVALICAFFIGGCASGKRLSTHSGKTALHIFQVLDAWEMVNKETWYCLPNTTSPPETYEDIPF